MYVYCEAGNLIDFVKSYTSKFREFPSQRIVQKILKSLCKALKILHSSKICHRNLKVKYVMLKYKDLNALAEKYKSINDNCLLAKDDK